MSKWTSVRPWLWVGQFEPYTAKACYTAGYCLFESHSNTSASPQGSMGAMR